VVLSNWPISCVTKKYFPVFITTYTSFQHFSIGKQTLFTIFCSVMGSMHSPLKDSCKSYFQDECCVTLKWTELKKHNCLLPVTWEWIILCVWIPWTRYTKKISWHIEIKVKIFADSSLNSAWVNSNLYTFKCIPLDFILPKRLKLFNKQMITFYFRNIITLLINIFMCICIFRGSPENISFLFQNYFPKNSVEVSNHWLFKNIQHFREAVLFTDGWAMC
jgi:hypothetical protein